MPKDSKYQKSWETQFPWVRPVANNQSRASCNICKTDFSVSNKAVQAVKQHENSATHKINLQAIAKTPKIDTVFAGKFIYVYSHIV